MTAHDHKTRVEGCFRCELNQDEIGIADTGQPSSVARLTRLHDELWLDLNEVVSVTTKTSKTTYARVVTLTTRSGETHGIIVGGTSGNRITVGEGDAKLAAWLRKYLPGILADLDEETRP